MNHPSLPKQVNSCWNKLMQKLYFHRSIIWISFFEYEKNENILRMFMIGSLTLRVNGLDHFVMYILWYSKYFFVSLCPSQHRRWPFLPYPILVGCRFVQIFDFTSCILTATALANVLCSTALISYLATRWLLCLCLVGSTLHWSNS